MGLICTRPDATRDFEYSKGGSFKIGVIPRDVKHRISQFFIKDEDGEAYAEAVRYGIKGHSDLAFEDGTEVPLKMTKDTKERDIVASETIDIYHATEILVPLGCECLNKGAAVKWDALQEKVHSKLNQLATQNQEEASSAS